MNPLVSVIIPVRNRPDLIRRCIDVVRDSNYRYIEVIVVDGNSTDDTALVAQETADQVIIFPTKGDHRCAQRNLGVRESTGDYVLILDSDMEIGPHVISQAVEKMSDSSVSGVIVPEISFGEGFWAKCKALEKSFYLGIPWMEAARFYRRSDYLAVGGYDETMTSGEDWDLSQRMTSCGILSRTKDVIRHNEGNIGLIQTMKKKYYYAGELRKYVHATESKKNMMQQTSVLSRYKLYFSQPQKLFTRVDVGMGMLFMKTCELCFGALGYIFAKKK